MFIPSGVEGKPARGEALLTPTEKIGKGGSPLGFSRDKTNRPYTREEGKAYLMLVENPVEDPERSRGEHSRGEEKTALAEQPEKPARPGKTEMIKPSGELLVTLMSITPQAEQVIEQACRTCYLSFHRYNPPASTEELIKKI